MAETREARLRGLPRQPGRRQSRRAVLWKLGQHFRRPLARDYNFTDVGQCIWQAGRASVANGYAVQRLATANLRKRCGAATALDG